MALNNHAAIFRNSSGPYDPLARWAEVQRKNYRRFKDGKKTVLTEDRIEQLNAINFVWENKKKRIYRRMTRYVVSRRDKQHTYC